jgi:sarcosine oxidase subunit alpha
MFTFEGRKVPAREGQSIAAALLAAGVHVLSRSIKYRRPRGYTCGWEACGNCGLTVDGLPSVPACATLVRGGEIVHRDRGWPSAGLDLLRVTDLFTRFLPAGFQFRLFPRHPWLAHRAEAVMARFAGAVRLPSPDTAAKRRAVPVTDNADVLVVGGGLSGCAAALAAADAGARVALACRDELGGRSRVRIHLVARGKTAREVAAELAAQVARHPGISVLRGTALGWFEGGVVPVLTSTELVECRPAHLVVATGSYDVPALHPGSDKPGVMLADGVSRLLAMDHVKPGARAIVLTDSVRGYWLARQLSESGVSVVAVADRRENPGDDAAVLGSHAEVLAHADVERAIGLRRVRRVRVATSRSRRTYAANLLCVALTERPANELALQWRYAQAGSTDAVQGGWQETGPRDTRLTVVGSAAGWATDDINRAARAGTAAARAAMTQATRETT